MPLPRSARIAKREFWIENRVNNYKIKYVIEVVCGHEYVARSKDPFFNILEFSFWSLDEVTMYKDATSELKTLISQMGLSPFAIIRSPTMLVPNELYDKALEAMKIMNKTVRFETVRSSHTEESNG